MEEEIQRLTKERVIADLGLPTTLLQQKRRDQRFVKSQNEVPKLIDLLKEIFLSKYHLSNPDNLRERKIRTQIQFIEKIVLLLLYFIAASLILMNFEGIRKIGGGLIASAGLAGVVIGFAAQKALANLLAGFQIAFTQPIRMDDGVIVEGEWGRVEEITFTYVVIRFWDKRILIVPITYFLEKPFQNWTRTSADLLGVFSAWTSHHFNQ